MQDGGVGGILLLASLAGWNHSPASTANHLSYMHVCEIVSNGGVSAHTLKTKSQSQGLEYVARGSQFPSAAAAAPNGKGQGLPGVGVKHWETGEADIVMAGSTGDLPWTRGCVPLFHLLPGRLDSQASFRSSLSSILNTPPKSAHVITQTRNTTGATALHTVSFLFLLIRSRC